MKLSLAAAAACLLVPALAQAQAWPAKNRELKIIIGYAPGSGADTSTRYFAAKLGEVAQHTVIVENRPGMISSIGADAVAKAAPDGYTLLLASVTSSHAANRVLFKKLPYDPVKDFTPVTSLYRTTFILMVKSDAPYKSVAELTAAMKAKGSAASYAYGSPPALAAAEYWKAKAGLQAVGIAYKTSAASMSEMYSGQLDFQFIDGTFGSAQLRSGKLRGLAITSGQRSSLIDLPTMAEASGIPDFDIAPWWGVFLPAGAPQPIVQRLEGWFNQIVSSDETRKFLAQNGAEPVPGNSKTLAEGVLREMRKWEEFAKVAKFEQE